MIIRLLEEGQFEVPNDAVAGLNELDDALAAAVGADDEAGFRAALERLLERVRQQGVPLPDGTLVPSDAILPATDITMSEVRELLGDEGLVPD